MIWTRDYHEQIQLAVRVGRELEASEWHVQRSNHSATLPPPEKMNNSFCERKQTVILTIYTIPDWQKRCSLEFLKLINNS